MSLFQLDPRSSPNSVASIDAGRGPLTRQSEVRIYGVWPDGAKRWETYFGLTSAQAGAQAKASGVRVLQVETSSAPPESRGLPQWASKFNTQVRTRSFDLLLFSQELLSLLNAGLNLVESVEALAAKAQAGSERSTLRALEEQLHRGQKFSQVLEQQSHIFPPVYVASVRASERTGNLPQALERFIAYQQKFDVLRRKVITASIYPAMLLSVGFLVVLFLLGFVVPRFAAVYDSSGRDLPWLSGAMLQVGLFIHTHAIAVGVGLAVTLLGVFVYAKTGNAKSAALSWVLKLPGISRQTQTFRLSRFFRALSLLLSSGVPLLRAVGMMGGLLGTDNGQAARRLALHVEQGLAFSVALEREGLTSPVAQSLLKVGERSGQLAQMLEKAASFHDEEMSRWLDGVSRLLEPMLMLAIGLVIGSVVVLMYLPIFDLASSFR